MEVPLTQGKIALIDDEDWPVVAGRTWCAVRHHNTFYAKSSRHPSVMLHRLILPVPGGYQVDHINGDGLDNRRLNLRMATHGQNQQNGAKPRNNTSGLKGVVRKGTLWGAQIRSGGKAYYLGTFSTRLQAAWAYDDAARRLHGEFARLNFP